jgi:multicomponent Na+:H+ antiporter subunit C
MIAYSISAVLFSCGLYMILTSDHYFRKLIGLGVFQNGVLVFYIALSKISNGVTPVRAYDSASQILSNPLPHVLMLTAIVVGFSTLSVGLALIMRIRREFGSSSERVIIDKIFN